MQSTLDLSQSRVARPEPPQPSSRATRSQTHHQQQQLQQQLHQDVLTSSNSNGSGNKVRVLCLWSSIAGDDEINAQFTDVFSCVLAFVF